jgi:hypothetical protein
MYSSNGRKCLSVDLKEEYVDEFLSTLKHNPSSAQILLEKSKERNMYSHDYS